MFYFGGKNLTEKHNSLFLIFVTLNINPSIDNNDGNQSISSIDSDSCPTSDEHVEEAEEGEEGEEGQKEGQQGEKSYLEGEESEKGQEEGEHGEQNEQEGEESEKVQEEGEHGEHGEHAEHGEHGEQGQQEGQQGQQEGQHGKDTGKGNMIAESGQIVVLPKKTATKTTTKTKTKTTTKTTTSTNSQPPEFPDVDQNNSSSLNEDYFNESQTTFQIDESILEKFTDKAKKTIELKTRHYTNIQGLGNIEADIRTNAMNKEWRKARTDLTITVVKNMANIIRRFGIQA